MAFPTGWTGIKKVTIDQSKVAGSVNLSNFPTLIKDSNIPDDAFAAMQSGEAGYGFLAGHANLKAYYRFESGALTTDSSGQAHTLTAISDPAETTGRFGGGVDLDGNDAYSATDHADFKPASSFTIVGRIKTTTTSVGYIFSSQAQPSSTPSGVCLRINADGTAQFVIFRNTGTTQNTDYKVLATTNAFNDGNWHTFVAVWNGSSMLIYVDGILEASTSWAYAPGFQATNYVRIGCECLSGTNQNFLTGQLDDVFILNGTALSAAEVKFLHHGGADIRFTTDAAGTTEIPFEVVALNTGAKTAEIWVKVPTVDFDDNTIFYMWYGKSNATPYAVTDTYGSQAVWSDYKAVYHLEGNPSDATTNANHGTNQSITNSAYSTSNGKIGKGVILDGAADYVSIPDAANLRITGNLTVQALVKPNDATPNRSMIVFEKGNMQSISDAVYMLGVYNRQVILYVAKDSSVSSTQTGNTTMADNTYHLIHGVYVPSTSVKVYLNGSIDGTNTSSIISAIKSTTDACAIGRDGDYANRYFKDSVDEVRVRAGELTADWITTEYNMMFYPSTFLSMASLTDIKSVLGVAYSSIKKISGLAIASAKKISGVS